MFIWTKFQTGLIIMCCLVLIVWIFYILFWFISLFSRLIILGFSLQVAKNYYRADLKHAALARLSAVHRSLKVAKSGVKKRNRQAVRVRGRKWVGRSAIVISWIPFLFFGSGHLRISCVLDFIQFGLLNIIIGYWIMICRSFGWMVK